MDLRIITAESEPTALAAAKPRSEGFPHWRSRPLQRKRGKQESRRNSARIVLFSPRLLHRGRAWMRSNRKYHDIFIRTKALIEGHFVLRSGLHSAHYFQCAQVCQCLPRSSGSAQLLLAKLNGLNSDVLAPAMGGLVIGQEVARQAQARYLFAEKKTTALVLRRGFTLAPGETRARRRGRGSRAAGACRNALKSSGGRARAGGHRDAGRSQRRDGAVRCAGLLAAGNEASTYRRINFRNGSRSGGREAGS